MKIKGQLAATAAGSAFTVAFAVVVLAIVAVAITAFTATASACTCTSCMHMTVSKLLVGGAANVGNLALEI
jgi:hypothetical protein